MFDDTCSGLPHWCDWERWDLTGLSRGFAGTVEFCCYLVKSRAGAWSRSSQDASEGPDDFSLSFCTPEVRGAGGEAAGVAAFNRKQQWK